MLTIRETENLLDKAIRGATRNPTPATSNLELTEAERQSILAARAAGGVTVSEAEKQRELEIWREMGRDNGITGAGLERFAEGAARGNPRNSRW